MFIIYTELPYSRTIRIFGLIDCNKYKVKKHNLASALKKLF